VNPLPAELPLPPPRMERTNKSRVAVGNGVAVVVADAISSRIVILRQMKPALIRTKAIRELRTKISPVQTGMLVAKIRAAKGWKKL